MKGKHSIKLLHSFNNLILIFLMLFFLFNILRFIVLSLQMVYRYSKWNTRPSWSSSYGSWIYNYLCNGCPSPLTMSVRILLKKGVLDTTLCDKDCQWRSVGRWYSPGSSVSSTNKSECHDIAEILLKVILNTITLTSQN